MASALQARLDARIEKIKKLSKVVDTPKSADKKFMVTTNNNGELLYHSLKFPEISKLFNQANQSIFLGCIHDGVSFHSILNLSIKTEDVSRLLSKLQAHHFSVHPTNTPNYKRILIPLSKQINDEGVFNECIQSISQSVGIRLSANFYTDSFSQIITTEQINTGIYFDIKLFSKALKSERTKLKTEKHKRKLVAIREGVYRVKRLSSDAKASHKADALQNVSSYSFIGFLKAPFTVSQLIDYSTDPSIGCIMAQGLGIPFKVIQSLRGFSTSTSFKCLLTGGDAQLFVAENNTRYTGKVTYKILSTGELLSMHEVYVRMLTQRSDFNKPTLMCYMLRLLDDCGLIIKDEVATKDLTSSLSAAEITVFENYKQLTELKHCIKGQEGDPIVFTKTFASLWSNVSRITATKAINKLVSLNVIKYIGDVSDFAAYVFSDFISKTAELVKDQQQTLNTKLAEVAPYKLASEISKESISKYKNTGNIDPHSGVGFEFAEQQRCKPVLPNNGVTFKLPSSVEHMLKKLRMKKEE
jgi:hypothetical protein